MQPRSNGSHGFGLLEAIVALAILAGSGMALFAWIGQNLRDVRRIEEAQVQAALQLEALGLLASINPFVERTGERRLGNLKLQWRSDEVEPVRPSLPFGGSAGVRWHVGLYKLDVLVTDELSGLRAEFTIEQPGLDMTEAVVRTKEPRP